LSGIQIAYVMNDFISVLVTHVAELRVTVVHNTELGEALHTLQVAEEVFDGPGFLKVVVHQGKHV